MHLLLLAVVTLVIAAALLRLYVVTRTVPVLLLEMACVFALGAGIASYLRFRGLAVDVLIALSLAAFGWAAARILTIDHPVWRQFQTAGILALLRGDRLPDLPPADAAVLPPRLTIWTGVLIFLACGAASLLFWPAGTMAGWTLLLWGAQLMVASLVYLRH